MTYFPMGAADRNPRSMCLNESDIYFRVIRQSFALALSVANEQIVTLTCGFGLWASLNESH